MKTHYPAIALLIFFGSSLAIHAQNSPAIIFTDFDNTSKPFVQNDSTFCKGQSITLHGQNFKRATSGEAWDTTIVYLGGNRIWPNSITSQGGGTNDRIILDLPNVYVNDTCLTLEIWKRTVQFPDTFFYKYYDTICVGGDFVQISYAQDSFCVGDANPFPSIILGPNTTGGFCCFAGAASFAVFPNSGEIPLHQGAVGNANSFQYQSNHTFCGDTLSFTVAILPRMQSFASINGQQFFNTCEFAPAVSPDSIFPIGGYFTNYSGLVLIDSILGKFDPSQSPVGLHRLWYHPADLCFDNSFIEVQINAVASTALTYPTIPIYQGVPTLCKSAAPVFPVFASGNAGGNFIASPSGLSIGANGQIVPNLSQVGTYSLEYITTGPCADTILVLPQIRIDTAVSAAFSLPQSLYCTDEFIQPNAANSGGNWGILSSGNQVLSGTNSLPISVANLPTGNSYGLCHITSGACPDSAIVGFTIPNQDTANFLYPPNGNFCFGDPDPYPLILGTGGGIFQALSQNTILGSGGRLFIQNSGVGTHLIQYKTLGDCPDSTTTSVQIFGSASALFSYAQSSFCQSDTNPIPTIQGTLGGSFSASNGLPINSLTGEIDLQNSNAGIYNVTYSLVGNCQATFTTTIQIEPTDTSTTMAYPSAQYCQENSDPRPLILGDSIGRFIAGAGIIFSNTDRGELDLSAMQIGGPYLVTFDIANRCADDPTDSIWILPADNASFSYPELEYCQGAANPIPDFIALNGGVFSEPTGFVQFVNTATGEIDANSSQSGGPFSIRYTTAGACPQSSEMPLIMLPAPQNASLDVFPGINYCEGHNITLAANSIGAASWKFVLNGDSLPNTNRNEYALLSSQLSEIDTVQAIVFTADGCSDTLSEVLTAIPRPEIIVLDSSIEINAVGLASAKITVDADFSNAILFWSLGNNLVRDSVKLPTTITIDTLISVLNDPFSLNIDLIVKEGDCQGARRISLKAFENSGFFIPEVITPDGNGMNDTWMVTWKDGIDPSEYRIVLFNGAGGKVYEMNGLHQNFDGGALPDGVYWWTLMDLSGGSLLNGGLTIRRR